MKKTIISVSILFFAAFTTLGQSVTLSPSVANQVSIRSYSTDFAQFSAYKSGGTATSPAAVTSFTYLGGLFAYGHTGSGFTSAFNAGIGLASAQNFTPSANGTFIDFLTTANNATATNVRMRLTDIGNVGIGTTTPNGNLSFNNTNNNRKILLYEDANNENQFMGFGVNAQTLRYQIPSLSNSHVFYAGTSTTNSNELMRITGTGNVGIGAFPGAKLEVNGFTKLGSDAPAIKQKLITATTPSTVSGINYITHGLTATKILDVNIFVETTVVFSTTSTVQYQVPPRYISVFGLFYDFIVRNNDIEFTLGDNANVDNNSSGILSKPMRILITYMD